MPNHPRPIPQNGSSLVTLKLPPNEIHIWNTWLRASTLVEPLRSLLSSDENARADRFYFQRDRDRFILSRGFLRIILSHYLDLLPSDLRFSYGEFGKPFLARDCNQQDLQFNVSHSGEMALFAFGRAIEIGVDIEQMRKGTVEDEVAEKFFSATEVSAFKSVPERDRQMAFFNCWTRKEAYIKAKGAGLAIQLDQFSVSLIPGEPARLLQTSCDSERSPWSLHSFQPAPGYVAALAVPLGECQVRSWQLPDLDVASLQKIAG